MTLWKLRYCENAGGYFVVRERKAKDGGYAFTEHGDVFHARLEDAERSLAIRNDGVINHQMRKFAEAKNA